MFVAFGLLALVVAAVGMYGVIAYNVAQRTQELAVRIALGATGAEVTTLVLRRGMVLAGAGLLAGVPAALVLSRFLGTLLYDVAPTDFATYLAASAGIALVALAASYVPARRATAVDPATTLRAE